MIQVRNLTKCYDGKTAVDNISFDIEPGRVYGFLGPNGAGKSTTMNMITGCISPTSGSITVAGHDILKDPIAAKKHIGYLPELPPLYPDMTPREYLNFVAEAKGVDAENTYLQVNHAMELTAITDVADRLMTNLSKGYCQRVGIAQALLGDPEVIILDEPTVGLDPKQIIEIRDLIRRLGASRTVILSSHILAEISAVCDHIMILSQGQLVANDTPEGLESAMNTISTVSMTVKAETAPCEKALTDVGNIAEYTVEFVPAEGCTHLSITGEQGADLREALFLAFANAGLPVLHLAADRLTLEDIFLRLTTPDIDQLTEEAIDSEANETPQDYADQDAAVHSEEEDC